MFPFGEAKTTKTILSVCGGPSLYKGETILRAGEFFLTEGRSCSEGGGFFLVKGQGYCELGWGRFFLI